MSHFHPLLLPSLYSLFRTFPNPYLRHNRLLRFLGLRPQNLRLHQNRLN